MSRRHGLAGAWSAEFAADPSLCRGGSQCLGLRIAAGAAPILPTPESFVYQSPIS